MVPLGARLRKQRLVIRFAQASLVAFVALGIALSAIIARQFRLRGEAQAKAHATFVTASILRHELERSDLRGPIEPSSKRYRQLSAFVRSRILRGGGGSEFKVVRIKIWDKSGTVLFSDAPALVGRNFGFEDDLRGAFEGIPQAGISNLTAAENVDERGLADKLFETYVPLRLNGKSDRVDAVVELYQDYAGIQREITDGFRTVATALLIGLAVLYILLLPIVFRTSRTLSEQNLKLGQQARRLEELLQKEQQRVAELRELNRLKSNFVAVASHELRTPLTSIIGYAKTLRQPQFAEDGASRREFVEAIERQGDRLFQLVENLLMTSHLEDSVLKLSISSFSFPELVRDVVEGLGSVREQVRLALASDLPSLLTDRQYVAQIAQNLLNNALKFSGPDAQCELGARWFPGSLEFWVADHGIGIPPEEVGRVFERFYQVDSSSTRRYGGIGLGLSLVQNLVEALGGTVEVESQLGVGSTFTVTLPLVHPSVAERYSAPTPSPCTPAPETNGHRAPGAAAGTAESVPAAATSA
jgi:signal transduction histidine kinase